MRDPYEVLGVAKGADIKDVKKAYRKLARTLHPDLHPGDKAAGGAVQGGGAAYDFLSDAEKKAAYDRGEIDASGAPRAERRFYRDFAEAGPRRRAMPTPTNSSTTWRGWTSSPTCSAALGARPATCAAPTSSSGSRSTSWMRSTVRSANSLLPDGRRLKVTIPPAPPTARRCG